MPRKKEHKFLGLAVVGWLLFAITATLLGATLAPKAQPADPQVQIAASTDLYLAYDQLGGDIIHEASQITMDYYQMLIAGNKGRINEQAQMLGDLILSIERNIRMSNQFIGWLEQNNQPLILIGLDPVKDISSVNRHKRDMIVLLSDVVSKRASIDE